MKTTYIFIAVVIVFILAFIFLGGPNPFAFGDAYFRPRNTPASPIPDPSFTVLPSGASPTNIIIEDVEVGEGVNIDR